MSEWNGIKFESAIVPIVIEWISLFIRRAAPCASRRSACDPSRAAASNRRCSRPFCRRAGHRPSPLAHPPASRRFFLFVIIRIRIRVRVRVYKLSFRVASRGDISCRLGSTFYNRVRGICAICAIWYSHVRAYSAVAQCVFATRYARYS